MLSQSVAVQVRLPPAWRLILTLLMVCVVSICPQNQEVGFESRRGRAAGYHSNRKLRVHGLVQRLCWGGGVVVVEGQASMDTFKYQFLLSLRSFAAAYKDSYNPFWTLRAALLSLASSSSDFVFFRRTNVENFKFQVSGRRKIEHLRHTATYTTTYVRSEERTQGKL
jgi:hypothetical protein